MAGEWEEFSIESIAAELGDAPFGSKIKSKDYVEDGILVVQGRNVRGRSFDWSNLRFVTPEKYKSLERSHVSVGDLIFPKVGTIGKVGILSGYEGRSRYLLSTNTMRLRPNPALANTKYVYYFFSWERTRAYIQRISSSSVQPVFNYTSLKKFRIPLPPLAEQKAIAHILGTLDDKIELNRRMNETLEEMARTLFKSWFVDFDPVRAKLDGRQPVGMDAETAALFPAEFQDSELGKIPKGWEVKSVPEIAEIVDCLHSKKPEAQDNGELLLQVFNVGQRGFLDLTKPYLVNAEDYQVWTKRIEIKSGDLIITKTGRVGAIAQIPYGIKAAMGRNMVAMRPREGVVSARFFRALFLSDSMSRQINSNTNDGTILKSLHVKAINKLRWAMPNQEVMRIFEGLAEEVFRQAEDIVFQSQSLASLRDTLLPKLLSGELRIKDAEKFVENAL